MNIPKCPVTFSSIVGIGEDILKIEAETGRKFLKLHRGVIDVTTIELNWIKKYLDINTKQLQQYSANNGIPQLIETIKKIFTLDESHVLITPGGMAGLDLILSSLGDTLFWLPQYHWLSWSKILSVNGKDNIKIFDDFNLKNFTPTDGVVMLCYPGNPTGFQAPMKDLLEFINRCKAKNVTVIFDMPYFYLFNDFSTNISDLLQDHVIICNSFSKSVGLSGFRIGYVATKDKELYEHMRIRSLYKYNSISTVAQQIINILFNKGAEQIKNYREETLKHIQKNIELLEKKKLLFEKYPSVPTGSFAVINKDYQALLDKDISSVPLKKFTLHPKPEDEKYSRISVAVNSELFETYFEKI